MNCLFETVASMWIMTLRTIKGKTQHNFDDETVQEGLEGCRMSLEVREAELSETCKRLGREALKRKAQSDISGAKSKLMERRRAMKRLEKLRNILALVDTQLDALRNTEFDRELMMTLMASSAALKKAGVGTGVKEAEAVMSELDDQMREASELNSVLSNQALDVDLDFDIDEELRNFLEEDVEDAKNVAVVGIVPEPSIKLPSPPIKIQSVVEEDEDEEERKRGERVALLPTYAPVSQKSRNGMALSGGSGHSRQVSRMIL